MVKQSFFLLAVTGTALLASAANAQILGRHIDPMTVRPSVETHLEVLSALENNGESASSAPAPVETAPARTQATAPAAFVLASAEPVRAPVTVARQTEPKQVAALSPAAPVVKTPAAPKPAETQVASLLPVAAASSVPVTDAAAVSPAPAVSVNGVGHGVVEAGLNYHDVSDNLGNWFGQYVKSEYQLTGRHRLNGEIVHQREFKDDGFYFAIGDTYIFNDDWFGSLSIGTSTDGFFYPRYRVDAFLYRKWLPSKNLITSIGVGEYKARQIYKDRNISFGATYYFAAPWIVEAGIRFNDSDPGSVNSTSGYGAITQGENKKHFVTLRYGFGDESYQIIAPGSPISDFSSNEISLTWRQWLADDWGFNVRGERYHNPNYDRKGITLGLFKEF